MKRFFEYRELHDYRAEEILFSDCAPCMQISKQPLPIHLDHGRHNHQGTVSYSDLVLDLMAKELLQNALNYRSFHVNRLSGIKNNNRRVLFVIAVGSTENLVHSPIT